jgi:hypothetical protein
MGHQCFPFRLITPLHFFATTLLHLSGGFTSWQLCSPSADHKENISPEYIRQVSRHTPRRVPQTFCCSGFEWRPPGGPYVALPSRLYMCVSVELEAYSFLAPPPMFRTKGGGQNSYDRSEHQSHTSRHFSLHAGNASLPVSQVPETRHQRLACESTPCSIYLLLP